MSLEELNYSTAWAPTPITLCSVDYLFSFGAHFGCSAALFLTVHCFSSYLWWIGQEDGKAEKMDGGRQARFAIRNLGMFHSFSHAQVAGRYYNPSHSTRKNCVIKGAGGKGTQVNRSLFSLCYSSGCGPLFFVHTHHYTLIIGCVGLIGLTWFDRTNTKRSEKAATFFRK